MSGCGGAARFFPAVTGIAATQRGGGAREAPAHAGKFERWPYGFAAGLDCVRAREHAQGRKCWPAWAGVAADTRAEPTAAGALG
jgi:hypothetical protein